MELSVTGTGYAGPVSGTCLAEVGADDMQCVFDGQCVRDAIQVEGRRLEFCSIGRKQGKRP